ncbi:MAG: tyrosine-type recombinase/integrase [Propionibacteriales bacterium]|nr:tyrosine-type recombinase/integrase [Propionibacteriales bacterium]
MSDLVLMPVAVALVDVDEPPGAAVAAVESWAVTLASPSTRRAYRHAVLTLVREHGEITPATVASWRDRQVGAGLSLATIRQRMAAVRAFGAWATRTGRLPAQLVLDLAMVQVPRLSGQHAPAAIGAEQLRLMDQAADALWPEDPLRVAQARVVLRVLGGCGLRVAELTVAELLDVVCTRPTVADRTVLAGRTVQAWQLHVHGKRGRRRSVPVPASVRRALQTYHQQLPHPAATLVPALSKHKPAQPLQDAIAVRTSQTVIARLAAQVNAAAGEVLIAVDHAHPHALRHGYALRYLAQKGATLAGLQRRLGHTDIATTAKYLAAHQDGLEPAPLDPWARA